MDKNRDAWIQTSDDTFCDIGLVSRAEIEKLWGSRWAQKCIRDVSEQVAIARFSPHLRQRKQDFRPPQLGFENAEATLVVSPCVDVKPAILYGVPLQDFDTWTVYLHVRQGMRVLGLFPIDFRLEMVVSQEEALELVRLFFDYSAKDMPGRARIWRHEIREHYRHRLVGAFFL